MELNETQIKALCYIYLLKTYPVTIYKILCPEEYNRYPLLAREQIESFLDEYIRKEVTK